MLRRLGGNLVCVVGTENDSPIAWLKTTWSSFFWKWDVVLQLCADKFISPYLADNSAEKMELNQVQTPQDIIRDPFVLEFAGL